MFFWDCILLLIAVTTLRRFPASAISKVVPGSSMLLTYMNGHLLCSGAFLRIQSKSKNSSMQIPMNSYRHSKF